MKTCFLSLLIFAGCAPEFVLSVKPLTPGNIDSQPAIARHIPLPAFAIRVLNHSGNDVRFDAVDFHPAGHPRFLPIVLSPQIEQFIYGSDLFFEPGLRIKNGTTRSGYVSFTAWPPRPAGSDDPYLAAASGSLSITFIDDQGHPRIFVMQLKRDP